MTNYRLLKCGEIIQAGDEADASRDFNADCIWRPVAKHSIGKAASDPKFPAHTCYRRKIENEKVNMVQGDWSDIFVTVIEGASEGVHETAVSHGWWKDGDRNFGEICALLHSEVSEAFEAYREGNPQSVKVPDFTCIEEELADVIIRIFDYAARENLPLGEVILAKMAYNNGRSYRHGGKVA